MFCVLFEVEMRTGKGDSYFQIANALKPELQNVPGFVHNERYGGVAANDSYISFSTWETERALIKWRTHTKHHHSQSRGRTDIFQNYRLRIGAMVSSTREPTDVRRSVDNIELTEVSATTSVVVCEHNLPKSPLETSLPAERCREHRAFRSLVREGVQMELTGWRSIPDAEEYMLQLRTFDQAEPFRARHFCVLRDYSLLGRDEAPQYYPKVRMPDALEPV